MARRLRCLLGRRRWRRIRTDDGGWYEQCRDCGKFVDLRRGGGLVERY